MVISNHFLYVKNWNHPIETTTNKWMFGVPGLYVFVLLKEDREWNSSTCVEQRKKTQAGLLRRRFVDWHFEVSGWRNIFSLPAEFLGLHFFLFWGMAIR